VGEVENVAAGLNRSFSITLQPGNYTTSCPGGKSAAKGTLAVTGAAVKTGATTQLSQAAWTRTSASSTGVRRGGYVGEGLFAA
jgi:hypothetical protein